MGKPIVQENRLWNLFNDESKLFVITMLMDNGITGEVKLFAKIKDNVSYIDVEANNEIVMTLPIDIIPVLNN